MIKVPGFLSRTYNRGKAALSPLLPAPASSLGFDAPKHRIEDDRPDRAEIAVRTYSLLTELPLEWSVRVGLLGDWGEGKTSVANWVARKCADEGHLVVSYNPWNVKSDAQLWIGFAGKLLQTLDEHGIEVEGAKTLKGLVQFKKWADFPRKVSEYYKSSQIAFGVVEGLLSITPDDIKRLRAKFAAKRVVVIIDDLDRADPQLVPRLLLSLRELLDVPGFSFLLPFDHSVVASALAHYNESWGTGDKFLEKILDFRVLLPETTPDQRQTVFLEELRAHCQFIPEDAAHGLGDALPANPRRVKGLVRNLITLKRAAARHRPGEIDWRSILFASMIRMENPAFFSIYAAKLFKAEGRNPWLAAFVSKDSSRELDEQFQQLLTEANVGDENSRRRLFQLSARWKAASALGFDRARYAVNLLDQSEALTQGDYDELINIWRETGDIERVLAAVDEQSHQYGNEGDRLVLQFNRVLFAEYDLRLNAASESFLESDNAKANLDAGALFDLARALVASQAHRYPSADLRLETFVLTLRVAFKWAAFRRNPQDQIRRNDERDLLLSMLPSLGERWVDYAAAITKQFDSGLRDRDRQTLHVQLRQGIAYAVQLAANELLVHDHGIQSLLSSEIDLELRREMLDSNSAVWQPRGSSPGEVVLSRASGDPIIQRNAYALLELLQTIQSIGPQRAEEAARRFISDSHYLGAVWNAAIVTPLQYRNLQATRDLRGWLVNEGADPTVLSVPPWLAVT